MKDFFKGLEDLMGDGVLEDLFNECEDTTKEEQKIIDNATSKCCNARVKTKPLGGLMGKALFCSKCEKVCWTYNLPDESSS
jgi:hypothetical protein